jgi:hypothetical protein
MQLVQTNFLSGEAYWFDEACPEIKHGPFLNEHDAHDDIIEFNVAKGKRVIAIARVCHEVNRAFCAYLGDNSQPTWEDAPQWQKDSAIMGVYFHIDNPNAGDSASHDSWMQQKLAEGWVYGKVKDPDASPPTHHCIVAFEELPPEQQMKDTLFRSTVHNLWSLNA